MINNVRLLSLVLAGCIAVPCFAGNDGTTTRKYDMDKEILSEKTTTHYEDTEPNVFNANEWQGDVFGTYANADHGGSYTDGFGGGIGVNYFFTEYFGAGLEGYWWTGARPDTVLHNVGANLFARYPIQDLRLAPYVFIGPGGHFDGDKQVSGHGGGGIEWRFMDHIGWFADARYEFTSGPGDYALYRSGIRFVF